MSSYKWIDSLLSSWGAEMQDGGRGQEVNILHKVMVLGPDGAAVRSTGGTSVSPPLSSYSEKVEELLPKMSTDYSMIVINKYLLKRHYSQKRLAQHMNISEDQMRYRTERIYETLWPELEEFRREFE